MLIQDVLKRAHAACKQRITYEIGAGGRDPRADTPGATCDCSGFVMWCLGLDRLTDDPFYKAISGGWANTDAMVSDSKSPRGFLNLVPAGSARPGDFMVFGKGASRKYGHVGIISRVIRGLPTHVIHCSASNAPTAVQETDPAVFVHFDAVIVRHKDLVDVESGRITTLTWQGKISTFGGPKDTGVSASEGLALRSGGDVADPRLGSVFLPHQPIGTTGLARRLNPDAYYLACRWDYDITSRMLLRSILATVTNPRIGRRLEAAPVDWGPHISTGRVADLSPGLARALDLETDDDAIITIPLS